MTPTITIGHQRILINLHLQQISFFLLLFHYFKENFSSSYLKRIQVSIWISANVDMAEDLILLRVPRVALLMIPSRVPDTTQFHFLQKVRLDFYFKNVGISTGTREKTRRTSFRALSLSFALNSCHVLLWSSAPTRLLQSQAQLFLLPRAFLLSDWPAPGRFFSLSHTENIIPWTCRSCPALRGRTCPNFHFCSGYRII